MAKRKYISEFGLIMNMTHDLLIQQDDLYKVNLSNYFNKNNPCHIYFICRRPRIILNTNDFKIENGIILLPFQIQRQNNFENKYVEIPCIGEQDVILKSNYPYNIYEFSNKKGEILEKGKTALLFQKLVHQYESLLDLEVLYIGQSYGVEGSRTAPDRLKSHSTLQGIYSEAILRNPDCEIWLLLTSFEQLLISSFDGRITFSDQENLSDTNHLQNVLNTVMIEGLNEQQVINFTEAALIRYFQPSYNIEYKNSFPNPAHSTYAECYELDINSVVIEVNTENINCRLYSANISASFLHMKDFFLHSNLDRKNMFDFDLPFVSN